MAGAVLATTGAIAPLPAHPRPNRRATCSRFHPLPGAGPPPFRPGSADVSEDEEQDATVTPSQQRALRIALLATLGLVLIVVMSFLVVGIAYGAEHRWDRDDDRHRRVGPSQPVDLSLAGWISSSAAPSLSRSTSTL